MITPTIMLTTRTVTTSDGDRRTTAWQVNTWRHHCNNDDDANNTANQRANEAGYQTCDGPRAHFARDS